MRTAMAMKRLSNLAVIGALATVGTAQANAEQGTFPDFSKIFSAPEKKEPVPVAPAKAARPVAPKKVVASPAPAAPNRPVLPRSDVKQAAQSAQVDAEQARELYIRRKRRLDQIGAQQRELDNDKQALTRNRARMQAGLVETTKALHLSERRLTELEDRLVQARKAAQEQRVKLDDKTTQMSALFAVMQGMSRQPPPAMVTHSRDALNMIRGGMVMATFYGDIEKLATQVSGELTQLEVVQKDAEVQEQRRKAEQIQNTRLKAQIELLIIENREQLKTAQTSLEDLQNVAKIHTASLKTLQDVVPKIDEEVAKLSSLGLYQSELKQGAAELSPGEAKVAMQQPGRMKPSIPFSKAQGLLPMPVQGKILLRFGEERDKVPSSGLYVQTRALAQVISPCDGWITYAGPFRSDGQLLIINTGDGYHIYMAGMERTHVSVGQFVLAGEPVAVMGPAETRPGENVSVQPTLSLEFRKDKDKQSIDPGPWWSAGVGRG